MTDALFITILLSLVAVLFGIILTMVGWIGNKLYSKLGVIEASMHNTETVVHGRIGTLDRRITRVEMKCGITGVMTG